MHYLHLGQRLRSGGLDFLEALQLLLQELYKQRYRFNQRTLIRLTWPCLSMSMAVCMQERYFDLYCLSFLTFARQVSTNQSGCCEAMLSVRSGFCRVAVIMLFSSTATDSNQPEINVTNKSNAIALDNDSQNHSTVA